MFGLSVVVVACGEAPQEPVDPPVVVERIIEAQGSYLRDQLDRVARLADSVDAAAAAAGALVPELRAAIDEAEVRRERLAAAVRAFPKGAEGDALSEAERLRRELGELDAEFARLRRRLIR